MSGKWAPGGGRNMYTRGALNERGENMCSVLLFTNEFNNNIHYQYKTLVFKNTLLLNSKTLARTFIPLSKQSYELEVLPFIMEYLET